MVKIGVNPSGNGVPSGAECAIRKAKTALARLYAAPVVFLSRMEDMFIALNTLRCWDDAFVPESEV